MRRQSLRFRGARAAAAVAFGCGGVLIVVSVMGVVAGQARFGRAPMRAGASGDPLAPVTLTYTGGEQTCIFPQG